MHLNLKQIVLLFAGIGLLLSVAQAQKRAVDAEGHEWWKHAVFYEVYPRSFADSNNDGIGDLKGIDLHLDYLKDLGVDAIWITPCYPSPQVDFGYDVSDYENIDPMYGTLKDFKHLARDARKQDIRIIMDFVLNHTSPQHNWFLDSASSRTSAHRDWYIWRDGKGPGVPPNNWISGFGGPGNLTPRPASTTTISLLSASPISTGAIQRLKKPCSMSLAFGTNTVFPVFGSMPWTSCLRIRIFTTTQCSRARTTSATPTWRTSTTTNCPRFTLS